MRGRWILVAAAAATAGVVALACSGSGGSGGGGSSSGGGSGSSGGSGGGSSGSGGSGSSSGSLPAPTVLAGGQNGVLAIAVDSTSVYWLDKNTANGTAYNGTIRKVALGGGTVTTLVKGIAGLFLALDSGTLFYTVEGSTSAIESLPVGGGTPAVVLKSTVSSNEFDQFALLSPNLYYIDSDKIESLPESGGTPKVLVKEGTLVSQYDIAVDSTSAYWVERRGAGTTGGGIQKVPLAGAATPTNLVTGLNTPTLIAIDASNAYYADLNANVIGKVPLAGGAATVLASGVIPGSIGPQKYVENPTGIAVDATTVYWTDYGNSRVMSVPIAGGTPTMLAQIMPPPNCIALDASNVYVGTDGPNGSIEKIAK